MADWATISSFATAGGTFVLALATYSAVRSSNRSARTAERSLLAGVRPLLLASRTQDPDQKITFVDQHFVHIAGSGGSAEVTDEAIYLAMSLRNVGTGLAILHGWVVHPEQLTSAVPHPALEDFHALTRDIYVAAGDIGFWQGALRDPHAEEFGPVRRAIESRGIMTLDLLYGDIEGGQRMISRFGLMARTDGTWLANPARHWNIDRPDPR
ncbi:MAG: hypothetical protein QOE19_2218 [Actinomycetota bacterium]|jgi:hypothetical protein|nr:hypothetical protein [Actinomycetota bacterium]MDQ1665264.1 hypothetical protein [Actinomycetota bacterium]